jgi:hypothetical protein
MSQQTNNSNKQNDSSKLESIDNLEKKFKRKSDLQTEIAELRALAAAQEISNKNLIEKLNNKEKEIAHLKTLLEATAPFVGIQDQNEEIIAEIQLNKLRKKAEIVELTLEEARKFEIFSKIKSNNKTRTVTPLYQRIDDPSKEKNLIEIAQTTISQDNPPKDE